MSEQQTLPAAGLAASRPAARASWAPWAVAAGVLVLAIVPTAMFNSYHLFQFAMVVVYALAVLGLSILTGFNGQISLGHGAFFGIGAYTTAILMFHFNVPYWATVPVAAVVCAAVGFLIGLPALRLEGMYLALTTFALAVAVPQILKLNAWQHLTGGVQGLVLNQPESPFGFLRDSQWLYLFCLAVAVAMYVAAWNLLRGRVGRAMMAIRDHAVAAEAMGINLSLVKTQTFAVSALYTGIAGSLAAMVVAFVAPDTFNFYLSITLFVGLVAGGAASIPGTIVGALFVEFVPNWAGDLSKAAPGVIYGGLLIAMLFLMPAGAGGFLNAMWRRIRPS